MAFVQRDKEIEAFSADGADETLTICVRLGNPVWRFQNPEAHDLQCQVDIGRVDAVSVVEDESKWPFTHKDLSRLLERPICRWVSSDIEVSNLAGSDLHDHKDIKCSEAGCHDHEEVAGQHRRGVISHERHPALRRDPLQHDRCANWLARS